MENSSHSWYKTYVKFSSTALLNSQLGTIKPPVSGYYDGRWLVLVGEEVV